MSVNVSVVQFRSNAKMLSGWGQALQSMGLCGDAIAVEITESLLLDTAAGVCSCLEGLRNAGIQLAVDDFGTGYSSLAYLTRFDVDFIKIDKSFIQSLGRNDSDRALCEAMILMAHKLGLRVIAEGVETAEQSRLLLGWGCDFAQGYLLSRPLPEANFESLLREQAQAAGSQSQAAGDRVLAKETIDETAAGS